MAAYPQSDLDEVFRALADPSRRLLLDSLNAHNGQTLRELCAGRAMARQSVSKHLAVLEAANLVTTVRRGREKLHYLNPAPIGEIGERWIDRYERARVGVLTDLKRVLEDTTMERPEFVYTTYIRTTAEQLWRALTDPAFTQQYWGATFDSDWETGSAMTWHFAGATIADPAQVVLESDPYRRLAYSWHSFTPELAESLDLTSETREHVVAEQRSKVSFDIEELGEAVKLTVVHDGFEAGSIVASMVGRGWPRVLSGLKTLLETGETLPANPEPTVAAELRLTRAENPAARS
jgi:uncharacterized protein YndB with AHSA1/START domain/DNA-binding transcriptional ArsR family regulator